MQEDSSKKSSILRVFSWIIYSKKYNAKNSFSRIEFEIKNNTQIIDLQ